MVAGHLFLNECVPKDYTTRLWKTISDNNIVVEKKALSEQTADSFFGILSKQFPELANEERHAAVAKLRKMLCRFACENCMNFSEVSNDYVMTDNISCPTHKFP